MNTRSTFARLCLATLPALALTLSAAEGGREKADRPTERREQNDKPRSQAQAAPRDSDRGEPRGDAHPQAPGPRRPGGESTAPQGNRPAARDGERRGPGPEGSRTDNAPRREGAGHPPMEGAREGGNSGERQRHIREAIEHLRLAGLNDVAEHLQQNLSGGNHPRGAGQPSHAIPQRGQAPGGNRPSFQPPRGEGPQGRNFTSLMAGGAPGRAAQPPMAGGSPNELRELREQVAQLKKAVEELAKQRR